MEIEDEVLKSQFSTDLEAYPWGYKRVVYIIKYKGYECSIER